MKISNDQARIIAIELIKYKYPTKKNLISHLINKSSKIEGGKKTDNPFAGFPNLLVKMVNPTKGKKILTRSISNSFFDLLRSDKPQITSHNFRENVINQFEKLLCSKNQSLDSWFETFRSPFSETRWHVFTKGRVKSFDYILVGDLRILNNENCILEYNKRLVQEEEQIVNLTGEIIDTALSKLSANFQNGNDRGYLRMVHLISNNSENLPESMLGQFIFNFNDQIHSGPIVLVRNDLYPKLMAGAFPVYPLNKTNKYFPSNLSVEEELDVYKDIVRFLTHNKLGYYQSTPTVPINKINMFQEYLENKIQKWRPNNRRFYDVFISTPVSGELKNKSERGMRAEIKNLEDSIQDKISLCSHESKGHKLKFSNPLDRIKLLYSNDRKKSDDKYLENYEDDQNYFDPDETLDIIYNSQIYILYAPDGSKLLGSSVIIEAGWALSYKIPSIYFVEDKKSLPTFLRRLKGCPVSVIEIDKNNPNFDRIFDNNKVFEDLKGYIEPK